ncbi:MAG: class I SAM-dependent methyltransferase [Planctomycetaceae bacterium]
MNSMRCLNGLPPRRQRRCGLAVLLATVLLTVIAWDWAPTFAAPPQPLADDPAVPAAQASTTAAPTAEPSQSTIEIAGERPRPQEQARRTYMDRIVAAPMSHLGASWLVRPERQAEENVEKALQHLGLVDGMSVCDLGAGNGYWTLPLARAVGRTGQVYAVDIQPEMLRQLRTRAGKASLKNIRTVLGAVDDPKLPENVALDMLLMVDVYHEFSHPESMLWAIRRSLAPEGVIALLEYREEDPNVPIKPLHKMSKRQIMREYTANGFKLVREYNDLPWQHLMFFARDDSPLTEIEPEPFEVKQP